MATEVQFRGGTTNEHSSFNGVMREVTVDTDKKTLVVQDGTTNGGFPLLGEKNADNVKLHLGGNGTTDDGDLQIYHDGSNSYIKDSGTGDLLIGGDANISVVNAAASEFKAKFITDGAVELYNNGIKTFATTTNGAIVYGTEGAGAQLYLYADEGDDNSDKWKFSTGDNGNVYFQNYADGAWETNTLWNHGGSVELYWDNSKKFETTSGGATVTGTLTTTSGINAGSNISMNDDVYIKCGTHDDLQFFHSTNSYISNTTDTDLIIRNLGNAALEIKTQNSHAVGIKTNDEYSILCNPNAGVNIYHDGTKTFETFSKGVVVRGKAGDDGEIQLYADGGTANADCWLLKAESSAAEMDISNYADGAWERNIQFNANNSTNLYYDGSAKFWTTTSGIKIPVSTSGHGPEISSTGDVYPQITLGANRSSENNSLGYTVARWNGTDVAAIDFVAGPTTNSKNDGKIGFNTRANGGGMTRQMTIDDTGTVLIGTTTSHAGKFVVKDTDNSGNQIWVVGRANGNTGSISFRNNGDDAYVGRIQAGTTPGMEFQTAGSTRGSFDTSGNFIINNGNLKILTGGHGINFHDFATSGNPSSNLLDDYEEGTFTPHIDGGIDAQSYSNQQGHYIKIGNKVHLDIYIRVNDANSDGNQYIIGGFPFNLKNANHIRGGGCTTFADIPIDSNNGTTTQLTALYGYSASNKAYCYQGNNGTRGTSGTAMDGKYFIAHFEYIAA